jgi:Antibiotic biosynthesis monooxygenase
MFASIRRYRLHAGSMEELTRRVDEGFAERISAQPGFVSYEFVDCGDGEVMTISIFRDAEGAQASRELAQRWTEESLGNFEFARIETLHGEILVSRAAQDMLEPGHVGAARKFASARRYALREGSVEALMHKVDEIFADRIERLDGFEAYHALDCGSSEILSISLFRDQTSAEVSDDLALRFVGEELREFDIERTEVIGGEVIVSRAMAALLEPAHA